MYNVRDNFKLFVYKMSWYEAEWYPGTKGLQISFETKSWLPGYKQFLQVIPSLRSNIFTEKQW